MQRQHLRHGLQLGLAVASVATSLMVGNGFSGAATRVSQARSLHHPATITTTILPAATVNTPYSATLSQTGATGEIRWMVRHHETLPRGLRLSPLSGVISGVPRAAGTSTVDIVVLGKDTHSLGRATITITVNGAPIPSAASATLPSAVVGANYITTIAITGGTTPYQVTLTSGALPQGLHLGSHSGTIRGVPRAEGTFTFTIGILDRWHAAASAAFTMVVAGNASPTITTAALPVGTVGTAYATTLIAEGGTAPFAWSIARGKLPEGLNLAGSTGVISGTPRHSTLGRILTVRVTDANQVATTRTFIMAIAPAAAPVINTTQLPKATLDTPYMATLTASGGAGAYRWAIANGALPRGLFLDSETGVISGTPTESVIAAFTVAIRDRRNVLALQNETLTVFSS